MERVEDDMYIVGLIAAFVGGYFVGRKNPDLVDKLFAKVKRKLD